MRELELPVEGLLDVINPEEVMLRVGKTEDLWEILLRLDDLEALSRTGTA